jgi:3-hydroxybutyryl-CoA dehydrogenase
LPAVGVVGLGTMGTGIAQVCIEAGYDVVAVDVSQSLVDRAIANIRRGVYKRVEKGQMDAAAAERALKRITGTVSIADISSCFMVIEAVFEKPDVKGKAISSISDAVGDDTVIGTNTSSISITLLSRNARKPGNFIGMHFFNPVPLMPLVEIVSGLETSEYSLSTAKTVAKKMGKETVEAKDYPGFVSNRILMPMINEAVFALMEGVSSREGIDSVMKLGMNHPMGPLELADFIGLDICLDIMNVLHTGFGDSKYRPAPLLVNMVNAGKLGRKSGEGFYKY